MQWDGIAILSLLATVYVSISQKNDNDLRVKPKRVWRKIQGSLISIDSEVVIKSNF